MHKHLLYLVGIMLLPNVLFGQIVNYFVVENPNSASSKSSQVDIYNDPTALDTVHVMRIKPSIRENHTLVNLTYTDLDGQEQTLKNKLTRPTVVSMCKYGRFYDRVPLDANKSNPSAIRYLRRSIDGEIKCWVRDPRFKTSTETRVRRNPSPVNNRSMYTTETRTTQYGKYHFIVQLSTGEFIDIADRKVYESKFLPILEKCEDIQSKLEDISFPRKMTFYTKDLESELLDIILEYNEACAQED